jgi:hypothetical protein
MLIFSIANPSQLVRVGSLDTGEVIKGLCVSGNYAYIANYNNGLTIVDVSDPANPKKVGCYSKAIYAENVSISGSYAYIANGCNGVTIVDISDPSYPKEISSFDPYGSTWTRDVKINGKYAYVADNYLITLDISDPANPIEVSRSEKIYVSKLFMSGKYLFLAASAGFIITDISSSNISKPLVVGSYSYQLEPSDMVVYGKYAYITDRTRGLVTLDISYPSRPSVLARYVTDGYGGLTISEGYAYITCTIGLDVLDITKPAVPTNTFCYKTINYAYDVYVSGKYAYICDGQNGFTIFDVSNPAMPVEIGRNSNISFADRVFVSGNYAYVGGKNYLWILDIKSLTTH